MPDISAVTHALENSVPWQISMWQPEQQYVVLQFYIVTTQPEPSTVLKCQDTLHVLFRSQAARVKTTCGD